MKVILISLTLAMLVGVPAVATDSPDEDAAEKPTSTANYLRWRTATEQENFGYFVYRGESEDGPFVRLNRDPILGAGTTDEPSSYEYVDSDIDLYTTYWYYLESVGMDGVKEKFSPVFEKKAKLSRESEDSDAESSSAQSGNGHNEDG